MKLSEAIRLGAMLKPQGTGGHSIQGAATCALGAAADAIGLVEHPGHTDARYTEVNRLFPFLNDKHDTCPVVDCDCGTPGPLLGMVWHLNDFHRWTREQIADFIATVEPADRPQPQAETSVAIPA